MPCLRWTYVLILIGTAALVGSESSSDLPVASRDELVRAYNGKYSRFLALLMPCANTHLIGIVANLRLQLPYVKVFAVNNSDLQTITMATDGMNITEGVIVHKRAEAALEIYASPRLSEDVLGTLGRTGVYDPDGKLGKTEESRVRAEKEKEKEEKRKRKGKNNNSKKKKKSNNSKTCKSKGDKTGTATMCRNATPFDRYRKKSP